MQNFTIVNSQVKKLRILIAFLVIMLLMSCKKNEEVALVGDVATVEATVETTVDQVAKKYKQMVGDKLPDFTCETNKGEKFTLSKREKPVFLTVWATW